MANEPMSRGRDLAAARTADRQDRVPGAAGRAVEHRRRRRARAGGVRRACVLPELVKAQSANRDQRRLCATHHRRRPLLGARARVGVVLHHRDLAVVHPRVDPAPPFLLLAAVAAYVPDTTRSRAAPGYGGRPRTSGNFRRRRRRQSRDVHRTADQARGEIHGR